MTEDDSHMMAPILSDQWLQRINRHRQPDHLPAIRLRLVHNQNPFAADLDPVHEMAPVNLDRAMRLL